jgi:hypothetical protein
MLPSHYASGELHAVWDSVLYSYHIPLELVTSILTNYLAVHYLFMDRNGHVELETAQNLFKLNLFDNI